MNFLCLYLEHPAAFARYPVSADILLIENMRTFKCWRIFLSGRMPATGRTERHRSTRCSGRGPLHGSSALPRHCPNDICNDSSEPVRPASSRPSANFVASFDHIARARGSLTAAAEAVPHRRRVRPQAPEASLLLLHKNFVFPSRPGNSSTGSGASCRPRFSEAPSRACQIPLLASFSPAPP